MAQNDFVIADQGATAALADINSALQSLASCSSGSSEPSVKYANQLWYDTATNILKIRNEANSAWISVVYVHQSDNAAHILDNTYVSDTSGNHVGLIGDQATSEWTTGTGTTESLVSPAKLKSAVDGNATVAAKTSVPTSGITQFPVGSYTIWYSGGFPSAAALFSTIDASSTSFTVMDTSGGSYTQKTINYGTWMYMGRIYNVIGALVCRIS